MPGVGVIWSGQFPDHAVQQDLCACLMPLARASHHMYADFFNVQREVRWHDGSQTYPAVLLSKYVFGEQPLPAGLEEVDPGYFLVKDVSLYGMEFDLFDPRRFNSAIMMSQLCALSFVFLRSANPALDGLMVKVYKLNEESTHKFNTSTMLYISEIELRYYLVHWMVDFFAWIKHFLLPDLTYWEYDFNPRAYEYDEYDPSDRKARDELFLYLLEAFLEEAEGWKNACRIPRDLLNIKENPPDWLDRTDELYDHLAQQEKRRRNHST